MNAFSDIHEILTAFFDSLPWSVAMVDERGSVTFINREMRASGAAPSAPAGAPLAAMFPQYHAALRGEVAWLTPQAAVVTRDEQGCAVTERITLHRLPLGACLFVIRQPEATGGLGDAQLARLASLGFMVAGVCHEVANPLTAINSTVQLLRATPACPPALLEKGLANIAANVQRVLNISRKLNDFSRAGDDARAALNLFATVNDALSLSHQDSLMRGVSVVCTLDNATVVRGDPGQLQQVFCNVFTNAAQAMQGRGHLFIRDTRPDAHSVEIAIRDTGPGIDERDLPRLFEPFFTTKPAGHGTGLGLAISNEIVLAHGGSMRASNDAEGGACFYIRLPAASR
jgi:signal transduction histidine kinase